MKILAVIDTNIVPVIKAKHFILKRLSAGGVDSDYQCHYIRGGKILSEPAAVYGRY